tara:strand:- start:1216 stop:1509 length:294 start_codon:yes stop_codon:yes gene_type:complete
MDKLVKLILSVTSLTIADFFVFEKGGFIVKYAKWSKDQLDELTVAAKAVGLVVQVNPLGTQNKKTGVWYEPSTRISAPFIGSEEALVDAITKSLSGE